MKSATRLLCSMLAMLVLTFLPVCYGQGVSGMAGEVTDQTGAVVPGAVVTLANKATGLKFTLTTNAIGSYRFAELPPGGGYEATFSAKGFTTELVKDIYLTVATVRTQNATLKVGAHEEVQVSAANSEVTIDTSDAVVGNNIDVRSLLTLPVQQRDTPAALFEMQAGVTDTGSVAGSRVDQNDVTLDGLDVNDLVTGGVGYNSTPNGIQEGIRNQTIVGGAPVDSLEQFTGSVAGGEADSGPGSGGQFSLVTKGGTNQFHGNLNEYNRNTSFVANSWFSNNASPQVPRNHLIQNQFGGNIGGPITIPHLFSGKDKAFFFFDFNDNRIIRSALAQRTVPLDSLRNGNVGYINDAAGDVTSLTPAQFAAYDPLGKGTPSQWLSAFTSRFPHSNNSASGDGVNSGGLAFNAPDGETATNYVGRGDVNLNAKMKLFAKFSFIRGTSVLGINALPGDPISDPQSDRSYAFVIGHTWLITSATTNRINLGETVQKLSSVVTFNPSSSTWNPNGTTNYTFDDGTGPALVSAMYLAPGGQAQRVPVPVLRDDFSWTKGRHTFEFGGSFKDILIHTTNVTDFNETEEGMGGATLSLCGPTPSGASPACGGSNPDLRPANIQTAGGEGNLAVYDWDQAFAYMIGRIGEVSSVFNYAKDGTPLKQLTGDQRFYRSYQTQLYFQDSFKVVPSLTVSYGLGYQFFSVPYETRGLQAVENISFNQYLQARVAQSNEGLTGPQAVPLISYLLGGKGNGSSAPAMFQPEYKLMSPHVGFAWNPGFDKKRMVINASGGISYDRTVITAIMRLQDANSYLFQQPLPLPQGISGDPYDSIKSGPRLDKANDLSNVSGIVAPPTPKSPYLPFANPTSCAGLPVNPCGLFLGSAFNSATIDPGLKTPYNINFNFGVQRQMPWNMVLKANYVGHLGRRLIGQADVNQVLEFPDYTGKSNQTLGQAMGGLTKQLRAGATSATVQPEPFFEDVVGAGYTVFLVNNWGPFAYRGDFGDTVWFMADTGAPQNVGSAAQFSENSFYTNQGFSTYHGLLLTLNKNLSHGISYDLNYTFSHSIDNTSSFANSQGDTGIGGIGLICDIVRPRECRSRSDFDIRHYITTDATYQLPFGRKRMFANTVPTWVNEVIGQWDLSGLAIWHTGVPWSTVSNAFVASYSNDAPGILVGNPANIATHVTKVPGGAVNIFADASKAAGSFEGPIGFQIGPRNELQGPKFFNADLGLLKTFPIIGEGFHLTFRADAFNAFNHPNFNLPANNVYNGYDQQDITSSTFGVISSTVEQPGNLNNGARVLQLSLRLEF
ncbi:MAG: carboxypeptidase-like regulatory domain-containing protein [Terracidiphilus sp.]